MERDKVELAISKKALINPYQGLKEEDATKVSVIIPPETATLLRSVVPRRSALQQMINMFLYSIHDELIQNNVRYYTPENSDLVDEIVTRRCALVVASVQTDGDDDA